MNSCFSAYKLFYTGDIYHDPTLRSNCSIKCQESEITGKSTSFKNDLLEQWGQTLKARDPKDPLFREHVKKRAECQRSCLSKTGDYNECDAYCAKMDRICYDNCRSRSTKNIQQCSKICGYKIYLP